MTNPIKAWLKRIRDRPEPTYLESTALAAEVESGYWADHARALKAMARQEAKAKRSNHAVIASNEEIELCLISNEEMDDCWRNGGQYGTPIYMSPDGRTWPIKEVNCIASTTKGESDAKCD